MTLWNRVATLLALPALVLIGYAVYLFAGGNWGREYIKSRLARLRADLSYTITSTPTGGDCGVIGVWDFQTRTCTLAGQPARGTTIWLKGDSLILDGNGHRMTGDSAGRAVVIIGNSLNIVRGLGIEGYEHAIYLQYASRNTISDLSVSGTSGHAIHLTGQSNFNAIINNAVGPSGMHGIALFSSHGNFIANNRIQQTTDAIRLQSSDGNVIAMNEIRDSEIEGLDLHGSRANRAVLNNIFETTALPILDDLRGGNLYHLKSGGNFYSQYDSATGCTDTDIDGICDAGYKFAIGLDQRPLKRPYTMIVTPRP